MTSIISTHITVPVGYLYQPGWSGLKAHFLDVLFSRKPHRGKVTFTITTSKPDTVVLSNVALEPVLP
jgi:hypothetical protein